MRLWSIHPRYLDSKGLVALWREGLLAQKVLKGELKGYCNHPQLVRFRKTEDAVGSIGAYLGGVFGEAKARGFKFNENKIEQPVWDGVIPVNRGQLRYEFKWLLTKLELRDQSRYRKLRQIHRIEAHPLFVIRAGGIEQWERVKGLDRG